MFQIIALETQVKVLVEQKALDDAATKMQELVSVVEAAQKNFLAIPY